MSFLISELKKSVSKYLSKSSPKPVLEESRDIEEDVEKADLLDESKQVSEQYEYFTNDDLGQKFGINRDLTKSYKLYICLFEINKTLEKPFVQYYFEKKNGSHQFIETVLEPVLFEGIKKDEIIPAVIPLEGTEPATEQGTEQGTEKTVEEEQSTEEEGIEEISEEPEQGTEEIPEEPEQGTEQGIEEISEEPEQGTEQGTEQSTVEEEIEEIPEEPEQGTKQSTLEEEGIEEIPEQGTEQQEEQSTVEPRVIDIRNDNKMVGGDTISDIEEIYLKQCNDTIESHLNNITKDYKGFIEIDDTIYAFFETTSKKDIELISGSRFAIIDEITSGKKIIDTPILEPIIKMFEENPELLTMKDNEGNPVKNPIAVHMCKKTDSFYENTTKEDDEKKEGEDKDTELKIHHDVFGDVYLFSTDIITTLGSFFSFFTGGKHIKHYALFVENETIIKNEKENVIDYLKSATDSLTSFLTYTCISFDENGHHFWAVKSKLLFTEI